MCNHPLQIARAKAQSTGSGYFKNTTAELFILRCKANQLLSLKFLQQMRRQQGRNRLLHVVAFGAVEQPVQPAIVADFDASDPVARVNSIAR